MLKLHAIVLVLAAPLLAHADDRYFHIQVVDEQTGRGVPLIELRTTNEIRWYTDSQGNVAFREPGLMNQTVFFHVRGHGYEFPKDGFGYRGTAIPVKAGGSVQLKVKRINIAQRLYRTTGGGIYRDSVLLGKAVPLKEPVLNGLVFGCDSVENLIFDGKIWWFWGDTNRPAYPLGNFNMTGATSALPGKGGLDPEAGVQFDYFTDKQGFARGMAPVPGAGPTWISGLVALKDKGKDRMFAGYVKVRNFLEVYERGVVEWRPDKQVFEKVAQFKLDGPFPGGHPFPRTVQGVEYIYFANALPYCRVRADAAAIKNQDAYESFTCLKPGTKPADGKLDRQGDGPLVWGWKKNAVALNAQDQAKLVKAGTLRPEECLWNLHDGETGKVVTAASGSLYWNAYRQRWVMITLQAQGTSALGEIWYAEADSPVGPWLYARKIVTHDNYTFYNPKQHPMFDKQGGRVIFFEGTYTSMFAKNAVPTPRYDYNQIMYKLDLADARLALPAAVYPRGKNLAQLGFREPGKPLPEERAAFFALERPIVGSVAVIEQGGKLVVAAKDSKAPALFHALPADMRKPASVMVPLYEFTKGAERCYSTRPKMSGFQRTPQPICLVWRSVDRVTFPRD